METKQQAEANGIIAMADKIEHLETCLADAQRQRDDAWTEIENLREQVQQMHWALSGIRHDATDGRNWCKLIENIKSDREESERRQAALAFDLANLRRMLPEAEAVDDV